MSKSAPLARIVKTGGVQTFARISMVSCIAAAAAASLLSGCAGLRITVTVDELGRFLSPVSRAPSETEEDELPPPRRSRAGGTRGSSDESGSTEAPRAGSKGKTKKPAEGARSPEAESRPPSKGMKTAATSAEDPQAPENPRIATTRLPGTGDAEAAAEGGLAADASARLPRGALERDPDAKAFFPIADRYAAMPGPGGKALAAALARVRSGVILRGSCWDFVDAVYSDAGFGKEKRKNVFKGKVSGPYADPSILQPGDWVGTLNIYSATVTHSAIFVEWLDMESRTALTIDYPGNSRNEPGRFRVSDLSKLFQVDRGSEL